MANFLASPAGLLTQPPCHTPDHSQRPGTLLQGTQANGQGGAML